MNFTFALAAMAVIGMVGQPQDAPDVSGAWRVTFDTRPGRPSCQEWWILNADGTGRVLSGMEVTDFTWRVQSVKDGHDLVYAPTALIARPDCNAAALPNTSPDPVRRGIRMDADGRLRFCGVGTFATEAVTRREACWAVMERQDLATWTGDSPTAEDISADYAGTYDFQPAHEALRATAGCRTRWVLDADGGATLTSGEAVVHARWRMVSDVDTGRPGFEHRSHWLTVRDQVGNGRPDCQGRLLPEGLPPSRQHVLPLNNGTLIATLPPIPQANGEILTTGPIYRLVRDPPLQPPYGITTEQATQRPPSE